MSKADTDGSAWTIERIAEQMAAPASVPSSPLDAGEMDLLSRFVFDEAELLDARRYEDWLARFAPTCCYWVPLDPDCADPWSNLNLIFDHRPQLEDRIYRYGIGTVFSQEPPSVTSRVVGNVRAVAVPGTGTYLVSSRFVLVETRRGQVQVLSGTYTHLLQVDDAGVAMLGKRVGLITSRDYLSALTFVL